MPAIHLPRGWEIPEREATPEAVYLDRRRFLRAMGWTGLGAVGLLAGCSAGGAAADGGGGAAAGGGGGAAADGGGGAAAGGDRRALDPAVRMPPPSPTTRLYPAARNPRYVLDRPLTGEGVAARYVNFYEFTVEKERVWELVDSFTTRPWEVEIAGLVRQPRTIGVDDLVTALASKLEERLYRHRCVEAWSMAVPWTGIPLRDFVAWVEPLSAARFVRMVTFMRPSQAPGFARYGQYPWPYFEGLSRAEAVSELPLLATGIYGHELPKQHGAPLRLVVPWKYGYKSIKSIVRFEFTAEQPPNFWHQVSPREYDFRANVDPGVPHPRWSQATERVIGSGEQRPTLPYNGYGEFVAGLYGGR